MNPGNLGFVRTVNRGMALHVDRDVVLLNADTLVHGDWLRRIAAVAYSADDIGTVTPLSNDATILSYPSEGTPLADVSVPFLDGLAAAVSAPDDVVDLPTGVGFCFYIRRDCLDAVGYFEAETFGQGYGEENDFCWRARGRGWRNVAALNTFVGHVGGSSFGAEKAARIGAALAALDRRHPDYQPAVHAFIAADPMAPHRRALDLAWARALGSYPCLIVCPVLGGGTDRFVEGQVTTLRADGTGVLLLRAEGPPETPRVRLELPDAPHLRSMVYDAMADLPQLMRDLQGLGVERMIVHHVLKTTDGLLATLAGRWRYDVHIHDYIWICPRINLVDGGGRYCGEPAVTVCEECIQANGHELRPGLSVAMWRQSMAGFLAGAAQVICPSHDAARRLAVYAPGARMVVQPHPDIPIPPAAPLAAANPSRLRVAVVGAMGEPKGYDVLLGCALDAASRNLPVEFCLVGYSKDDGSLLATGRILITGRYDADEAGELIRLNGCHLGFLPSIWPETWSYTLTEMLAAGLRVAAFDLGAPAERLRAYGSGLLLPLGMAVPQVNDALLELGRRQGIVPSSGAGCVAPMA
ncbi:glycosyltransferase [Azospirillum sp. B4]|uniref:glycosyltransferase n=1 Tax=Azospirillum sp. B4 TaxID=95605 RepID=UPI00034BF8A0|nr:glycosyltransferase [Azospirillum sp. B4]